MIVQIFFECVLYWFLFRRKRYKVYFFRGEKRFTQFVWVVVFLVVLRIRNLRISFLIGLCFGFCRNIWIFGLIIQGFIFCKQNRKIKQKEKERLDRKDRKIKVWNFDEVVFCLFQFFNVFSKCVVQWLEICILIVDYMDLNIIFVFWIRY